MSNQVTNVVVNRMQHIPCQKVFYEVYGNELANCPNCLKELTTEDCKQTDSKRVQIDTLTGNLSFHDADLQLDDLGAGK